MMIGTNEAEYRNLLVQFLPRTIKSDEEYETVQAEIDRLVDRDTLSPAEEEYLDLLGALLREYETTTEERGDYELRGVELVKGLMELHDLRQTDLVPIFKTKSIASAVLSGRRRLTVEHIDRLAAFFCVPHSLFFDPLTTVPDTATVATEYTNARAHSKRCSRDA